MKRRMATWTTLAFAVCLVIGVSASKAHAVATISGTGPFTITQNTDLVGDVNCSTTTVDCITFAAPNLQLNLKGFTVTGPNADCTVRVGDAGINTNGQAHVRIVGPGKVQKFPFGILVTGSNTLVREIVVIRNCAVGIDVVSNKAQIRDNIVLKTPGNGTGINVQGNDNVVERNEAHGHGNGIGVSGTGNVIEKNSVTTNAGGIVLFAGGTNNRVGNNLVLNNSSVDIDDGGVANVVTGNIVTQNNVCEKGRGAAAQAVCADSPTQPFHINHLVGPAPAP